MEQLDRQPTTNKRCIGGDSTLPYEVENVNMRMLHNDNKRGTGIRYYWTFGNRNEMYYLGLKYTWDVD